MYGQRARGWNWARAAAAGGLILALAALPAQVPQTTAPPTPPPTPPETATQDPQTNGDRVLPEGRVTLDEVLAVVGGRTIWLSSVRQKVDAIAAGEESAGPPLTPQERQAQRQRIEAEVLDEMIGDRVLAHGAMTLDFVTPEEIELFLQRFTAEEEKDLIRTFGSIGEAVEELGRQDQSWRTYMQEKRDERLLQLANNETVARRLDGQASLFVTKKLMREVYEARKQIWVHGPEAMVEVMMFSGGSVPGGNGNGSGNGNGNGNTPEARAREASRAWTEGLSAREVADRFGGLLAAQPWTFSTDVSDSRAPEYREFALNNPEGAVSAPIARQGAYWVLRVARRREASNLPFANREVQRAIQNMLVDQVVDQLRYETLLRSQNRTYIWPPNLRNRR